MCAPLNLWSATDLTDPHRRKIATRATPLIVFPPSRCSKNGPATNIEFPQLFPCEPIADFSLYLRISDSVWNAVRPNILDRFLGQDELARGPLGLARLGLDPIRQASFVDEKVVLIVPIGFDFTLLAGLVQRFSSLESAKA